MDGEENSDKLPRHSYDLNNIGDVTVEKDDVISKQSEAETVASQNGSLGPASGHSARGDLSRDDEDDVIDDDEDDEEEDDNGVEDDHTRTSSSEHADDQVQIEALVRDLLEKVAQVLLWILSAAIRISRQIIAQAVRFFIHAIYALFTSLIGIAAFVGCVCLLECLNSGGNPRDTYDINVKLIYAIRSTVWSLIPVALALAVSRVSASPIHRAFLRQSQDHMLLALINTAISATYLDMTSLALVKNVFLASTVFRLTCWLATVSGLNIMRRVTAHAPTVVCFLFLLCNIYHVLSHGILPPSSKNVLHDISIQTDGDLDEEVQKVKRSEFAENMPWLMWIAAPLAALLGTNLRYAF